MKTLKKVVLLALVLALAVSVFAGCGGKDDDQTQQNQTAGKVDKDTADKDAEADTDAEPATPVAPKDGETYKVGVLQYLEHNALGAANEGFQDALNESGLNIDIEYQNAQGDSSNCQTIASSFVNDNKDLIFAIATPAAQAVAAKTTDIPILVSAVTDPADSGLVASNAAPGGNISGTSDMNPIDEQMGLLVDLVPDAKTVAILYCSSEDNSKLQADLAEQTLAEMGITAVHKTVTQSNEIQSVVASCVGEVDAIYAPTDNMIASAMTTVAKVANDAKIPVICGESNMVDAGGLITYGIDYYTLGRMTGEMAIRYFNGEASVGEMPIEYQDQDSLQLAINWDTADAIGITIPEELAAQSPRA